MDTRATQIQQPNTIVNSIKVSHVTIYHRRPRLNLAKAATADGGDTNASSASAAPWEITSYFTKKRNRPTDELGNIIDSPENTAESFAWTSETKVKLAVASLSNSLGVAPNILLQNLEQLPRVVPGGESTISKLRIADQIRLAAVLHDVPRRLIALRDTLPPALPVTSIVSQWPEAMILPCETISAGYTAVQNAFEHEIGEVGVCAMLATTPQLLEEETLCACLRGAGHLMPLMQLASSLTRYEEYWMQFQSLEKEPRNDYDDVLRDVSYYQDHGV